MRDSKTVTYYTKKLVPLALRAKIVALNSGIKPIIVSGDGDFYCLIEYLVDNNKLAKIIVPNKKYSSLLRKFAMFIVNISFLKDKLYKRK